MKHLILLFLSVFLFSCDSITDVLEEEEPWQFSYKSVQTIQYRTDVAIQDNNDISYDIYFDDEAEELRPVVIWVHGGGWTTGDKSNKIDYKKSYFESLGYVFVSINYRLSPSDDDDVPNDLLNENRIKFPIHPQDLASAVNTLYHEIGNFGGNKNKMVIVGHSAGAQLAMLIATDPQYLGDYGLNPKNVFKGVANFDTEGYNVREQLENNLNEYISASYPTINDVIDGLSVNYMNDYNAGIESNISQTIITYINGFGKNQSLWDEASAINHLNHSNKPFKYFIYYRDLLPDDIDLEATDENGVLLKKHYSIPDRYNLITNFISELENSNTSVFSKNISDYTHETMNDSIGRSNSMTNNLTLFLEECFQ